AYHMMIEARPASIVTARRTGASMTNDLAGKVVFITGASTGIGAAAARAFGRAGCRLLVHCNASREAAQVLVNELHAAGTTADLLQGDVTVEGTPARLVNEALALHGRIDVLVNN